MGLELWGGVECTRNRVGDEYFDQLSKSKHDRRLDDLDRIAALGIRTLRYPALWEQAAPDHPNAWDWSWADERLNRLRELKIRPIVGLVHHGSGPRYTNLLDPMFAEGLAEYAGRLAERFPWIDAYTPVNEPLTTARFSALYGHWHPHMRDALAFARALLNQCRGVALAMRAIRKVRPDAQLVQTEDLGKCHGTPGLRDQIAFENERRWLAFDLLCGKVDRHHPMGSYFLWLGVPESDLLRFAEEPCPPDIIGVNHYLTSERYLDERFERYPPHFRGSNGCQEYADVEAVRVLSAGPDGPERLLRETWERYRLPIAITEVHLGCTREEQLRWLWEVWRAAESAREAGLDVRAVTIWALLGSYDWDVLATQSRGYYEPGAFDARGPKLRATALAKLAGDLAANRTPDIPVLGQPGWWRRPERFIHQAAEPELQDSALSALGEAGRAMGNGAAQDRPLLIAGAGGTLGQAFERICAARGLPCRRLSRADWDVTDPEATASALAELRPWAVINASGYARVNDAERDPAACFRAHVLGAAVLAEACAQADIALATFSSDLVFDGRQVVPYRESDQINPLSVYAQAKAEAERRVLKLHPRALVIRPSAFFGPWDDRNFVTIALRTIASGHGFAAASDAVVSPTYLPDLAHAALDLLLDGESGVWHLANQGEVSWAELAREAARRAGLDCMAIEPRPVSAFGWPAARPSYSVLGSERGLLLPTWDNALGRYFAELALPLA